MPYATAANMILRYDARRIGQLVKDDGGKASPSELTSDAVLAEALLDASAMLEAAALRGGRYTRADLEGMTGQDAKFLIRIVCDLAYGLLVQRRGYTGDELAANAPAYAYAQQLLTSLAGGELIFPLPGAVAAGKPSRAVLSWKRKLVSATGRLYGDLRLTPANPGDPQELDP